MAEQEIDNNCKEVEKLVDSGPVDRELPSFLHVIRIILILIGSVVTIYQIFGIVVMDFVMWPRQYYSLLIGCFLPLVFLTKPHRKGATKIPWFDILAAIAIIICALYIFFNTVTIEYTGWEYTAPVEAMIVAVVFCLLILEATRRTAGTLFFSVCLFFFVLPVFTSYLPGLLQGISFSPSETIAYFVYGIDSLFGLVMTVMGNLLMGFLIFATTLVFTGGGEFFLKLASALVGGARGGPAKVAVIGSGFMGSMNGDVITNVITTGSFTIPAMKKLGYPAHYAGAVEACASTGGVLMPPIMGATAFLIAQILGISYADVALGALIPSLLYYFSLVLQVDAMAVKLDLKGMKKEDVPSALVTIKEGWPYIFGLTLLIIMLFYLRRVALAPFYSAGALIITYIIWKFKDLKKETLFQYLVSLGESIAVILPILLGVGFIIGSMITTGIASAFSREVIALAGGSAVLLLILGAFASFVLGMGMTISACYIFLAMTMAPPLIAMGFNPLATHLFVMYYAMLSFITPPVALGAFAGSTMACSPPNKTAFTAMRLGFVLYLVPFVFVLEPALVFQGTTLQTFYYLIFFIIGIVFVIGCTEGFIIGLGRLNKIERVVALIAGILLISPYLYLKIAGIIIGLLLIIYYKIKASNFKTA